MSVVAIENFRLANIFVGERNLVTMTCIDGRPCQAPQGDFKDFFLLQSNKVVGLINPLKDACSSCRGGPPQNSKQEP